MSGQHHPLRVRSAHVLWVSERLSDRDRAIVQTLDRLHVARGLDLERLHFADLEGRSRSVVRWRVLKRLVDWRVLRPLPRRVGGSLAGSADLAFTLDSAGIRLARGLDAGTAVRRWPRNLAVRTLPHRLGVTALFVALSELSLTASFTVDHFEVEPACWVPDGQGGWLKPDAYVRLSHHSTDHWWVEYDRGTEGPAALRAKVRAYVDFFRRGDPGPDSIVPWVLFSVPDARRLTEVEKAVRLLHAPDELFRVTEHKNAALVMSNQAREEDLRVL